MSPLHMPIVLKKKLDALSKEKDCGIVSEWRRSLVNHLYWCACSSEGDGEIMSAKWESVANHIQNMHKHHDNPLFPRCQHSQLKGRERKKKWLKPGMYIVIKRLMACTLIA